MKNSTLSSVLFILLFSFQQLCFAQSEPSADSYMKLAKAAESAGQSVQAANDYMQAGRMYMDESGTYIQNTSIYSKLKSARDCFSKAASYYHQRLKLREEDEAKQRLAMVDLTIALKGLEGLDYDDKKDYTEEKKPVEDKNQVPYKQGGDAFFITHKTTFVFNPPQTMKYNGIREQIDVPANKQRALFNMYGMQDGIRINLSEWIDDDKDGTRNSMEIMCEQGWKTLKQAEDNYQNASPKVKEMLKASNELSKTTFQELPLSFGKVCLRTTESTQFDTKKRVFLFEVSFYYNHNGYIFTGFSPIEWKNALLTAVKTFRVVNTKAPEESKCSNGENQLLEDKAFYDSYYLPDPSAKATITITPVLQRNKVPAAWHNIIAATRKVVAQIPDQEVSIETASEEMNEEAGKIIMYLNKLGFEAITPQKVADAYLEAFDKVIYGIEGLEASITNMSVNFSFTVPYTEVRTKCIPRIICNNGKWQPDYKTLQYQKLYERKAVEKYSREFMTMKQVQDVQQNLMGKFLENLGNDKKKYENAAKCEQHTYELRDVDFGVMPDECLQRKAKLASLQSEQAQLNEEKKYYDDDLVKYKKSKPAKLAAVKNAIAEIDKRITAKNKELASAETLKKNFESNPDKENPDRTKLLISEQDEKIDAAKESINELNRAKKEYVSEQNSMNANKYEKDVQQKINALVSRLNQLKTEIPAAQKSADSCK